ncbi:hypothetical protein [Anaerocellum diazotrophicum]|uniref:Uncharacterized protein n=1 Tax=Caldicellulosiruptor diazotrophicus TaxID=2806205 RepID=A0ABM7NJW4_9FIRM|nr:hypothetical protein [Caldicellulosiruptor diazotrophicus]BCS80392.1 hypothetical protein CaldiYA01_03520 [Caldicellulosiruptor diazotrophicus]
MVRISFEISDESLEKIKELIKDFEEDSYTKEDAYRAIFEMGIMAYQLQQSNSEEDDLRKQLLMLSSQYSVIKFKNFQLEKENRLLEMSLNGCEAENRFLRKLLGIKSEKK